MESSALIYDSDDDELQKRKAARLRDQGVVPSVPKEAAASAPANPNPIATSSDDDTDSDAEGSQFFDAEDVPKMHQQYASNARL